MAGNTWGRLFTVTTFGESHGAALGAIVDGCPPGIAVDEALLQVDLDRRKPGTSRYVTQRREADEARILSGVFEGVTTGTPIGLTLSRTPTSARAITPRSRTCSGPITPTTPTCRNTACATIAAAAAPRRAKLPCAWPPARSRAQGIGRVLRRGDLRLSEPAGADRAGSTRARGRA